MTFATDVLRQSVVVFSRNYLPMTRINIKRAIALLVDGKAEPLDITTEDGWIVRSPSVAIFVPPQIRLTFNSNERIWKVPPVNRREVLRRDNHSCQYCGSTKRLTLDHVIPKAQGGSHTWENVVAACEKCNSAKGDRTPTQAGMPLQSKPRAPMHPTVAFAEAFWSEHQIEEEVIGNR
ncbi:HNH nuclease [Oscillatoriales cyanobacterium USR001]|nr:HNH nuclease [Oscillatoriales cyanobacterium USR001]